MYMPATRALFSKYHVEAWPGHGVHKTTNIRLNFVADNVIVSWGSIYVFDGKDIELHCSYRFLPLAVEWLVNEYPSRSFYRVT